MKPRPVQPHWPEVLTEWCIIRTLGMAGWPQRLADEHGAQAAFVSEVSAYLRFCALDLREMEAEARRRAAIEEVCRRDAGSGYGAALETMATAQTGDLLASGRRVKGTESILRPAAEHRRYEFCLNNLRGPSADEARRAARTAAETYWSGVAACRLPEGFFASAPAGGAIDLMRTRFDLWWALFFRSLGSTLQETNPSYCRLLQALPTLRAESARPGQKFVLSALVHDWREANAEKFGLFKDIHFAVLEQRSFAKVDTVKAWFDRQAYGYKHDERVRAAAIRALYDGLNRALSDHREVRWDN